jgi:hypothetical protein
MSLGLVAGAAFGLGSVAVAQVSQDDVRALIAEGNSDASQRTSLMAGADGGHDGGFYLAGQGFRLNVSGAMQFRYYVNLREDDPGNSDDFESGFQNARTRLTFDGTVHEYWNFRVQGNFGHDGGGFALEDAYGTYDFGDGWTFGFGQFRVPLTREFMVDEIHQLAVERSLIEGAFSGMRAQGVWVGMTDEDYRFWGGFTDGAGSANSDFASSGESDLAFTGRFEYKTAGDWDRFADFTSEQGEEMAMLFGVAAHYQQTSMPSGSGTNAPGDSDSNIFRYTLDASIEGDGWNGFAALYGDHTETRAGGSDTDTDDFGVVVQGGYRFAEQTEVFGRYEGLFLDDDRAGLMEDTFSFLTFGVNQYYAGHAAKATADVVFSLEDTNPDLTGAGVLPNTLTGQLGDVDNPEVTFRFQFQLLF